MAISPKLPPLEPTIHTDRSSSQSSSSASSSDGESYIQQDGGGSEEVVMATRRASCVRACPTRPASLRVSPTCCKNSASPWMRRSDGDRVARLRHHLDKLRSLLPHSARSAEAGNVIADALRYKKLLRREILMLQEALPYAEQVNVKSLGSGGLQIGVSCNKQPGLLVALMEALESFGLVFANATISCLDDKIRIDAISTKENCERRGAVKMALMATIMRFSQINRRHPSG